MSQNWYHRAAGLGSVFDPDIWLSDYWGAGYFNLSLYWRFCRCVSNSVYKYTRVVNLMFAKPRRPILPFETGLQYYPWWWEDIQFMTESWSVDHLPLNTSEIIDCVIYNDRPSFCFPYSHHEREYQVCIIHTHTLNPRISKESLQGIFIVSPRNQAEWYFIKIQIYLVHTPPFPQPRSSPRLLPPPRDDLPNRIKSFHVSRRNLKDTPTPRALHTHPTTMHAISTRKRIMIPKRKMTSPQWSR